MQEKFTNPYDPSKWFKPAPDQRYHIVYLTTNLVNNKIYVGVHSTMKLEDGYLGSGQALLQAIKKYNRIQFKRVILFQCLSLDQAYDIEHEIVNIHFINRCDVYNLMQGGIKNRGCINKGKTFKEIHKDKAEMNLYNIRTAQLGRIKSQDEIDCTRNKLLGRKIIYSDEIKCKLTKERGGENNQNFGGKITGREDIKLKISNTKKITKVHALDKNSHAKIFIFISPDNIAHTVIGQAKHFSRDNNLSYTLLRNRINTKIELSNFSNIAIGTILHNPKSTNTIGWELRTLEYHNKFFND